MKKFLFLLIASISMCLASCQDVKAQSVKYDHFRIQNKSLAVGKATSLAAPSNVWVQIADTGSAKASVLLMGTDTSKVTGTKVAGMMIYSRADSTLRIYNGRRWKKVTVTD
jgi:hypothetical protein